MACAFLMSMICVCVIDHIPYTVHVLTLPLPHFLSLSPSFLVLGLQSLQDHCQQVLGSFKERIYRRYITLQEVIAKNALGTNSYNSTGLSCVCPVYVLCVSCVCPVCVLRVSCVCPACVLCVSCVCPVYVLSWYVLCVSRVCPSLLTFFAPPQLTGTRCTTWIIISGGVYDISRWLEEHPGMCTSTSDALSFDDTIE